MKKKATLLHQESSVTPFTLSMIHRGFHERLHREYTKPYLFFLPSFVIYKSFKIDWYGDWENFCQLGDRVIEKVKNNPSFSRRLLKDVMQRGNSVRRAIENAQKVDIGKTSSVRLSALLEKIYRRSCSLSDVGLVAVVPDLRRNELSRILKNVIAENIKRHGLRGEKNEYFSALVTPARHTSGQMEKISLMELANLLKKYQKTIFRKKDFSEQLYFFQKDFSKEYKFLEAIRKRYYFLTFGHMGPEKTIENYFEELCHFMADGNLAKKLFSLKAEIRELKKKQALYERKLRLGRQERNLFAAARDFSFNKSFRYDVSMQAYCFIDRLLAEIARRTGYSVMDLRFLSLEEVQKLLKKGKKPNREEIRERRKFCVTVVAGGKIRFLTGEKARDYLKKHIQKEKVEQDTFNLHGSAAFLGVARGMAKIVDSREDIDKMKKGDVLVSIQTNPELLPAMKIASAFVTDIGGITSHAAIVARELKKPCVIGTKIATQIIKDGDLVEVDANKGNVRIIKRAKR